MKKRNNGFNLSNEEVVEEYLKLYDSHSHHKHRHDSNEDESISQEKKENLKDMVEENKSSGRVSKHHSSHHHSYRRSSDAHSSHKKKKKSLALRVLIIIVAILFFLAILGGGAFLIMRQKGKNQILKDRSDVVIQSIDNVVSYDETGKTVEYKGQKYVFNENVVTMAFLGIDDKSFGVSETESYGSAGQADTIMILAYDTKNGTVSIITVPRDSMVDVDIYSKSGNFARTEKMQICLSFAYGNGKESSCENVIKSLERLFMGVPIDTYFSLRVRGVDDLNAAVGGIKLTSLETIGGFTKGKKVHLTGTQARYYCTARDKSKIDSDSLRRERQIQYIKAYTSEVMKIAKDDIGIVTKLYNTAMKYSVTDITLSSAVYIASEMLANSVTIGKITSLKGNYINTDSYPQYILNEESVYETILDIFYDKV